MAWEDNRVAQTIRRVRKWMYHHYWSSTPAVSVFLPTSYSGDEQRWIFFFCTVRSDNFRFIFFYFSNSENNWHGLNHHHHVMPPVRISLILFRHFSLSFIASGRSSELHSVSSQSCCMYVRAGRPAFARPYVGVQTTWNPLSVWNEK